MTIPDPPWKQKTRPCPFYSQGHCLFSDSCNFLHDVKVKVKVHHEEIVPLITGPSSHSTPLNPFETAELAKNIPTTNITSPPRSPRISSLLLALGDAIDKDEEGETIQESLLSPTGIPLPSSSGSVTYSTLPVEEEEEDESIIASSSFIAESDDEYDTGEEENEDVHRVILQQTETVQDPSQLESPPHREDSIDSGYADNWTGPSPMALSPPRSPRRYSTFDLLSSPFQIPPARIWSPTLAPSSAAGWPAPAPHSPRTPVSAHPQQSPPEHREPSHSLSDDLDSPTDYYVERSRRSSQIDPEATVKIPLTAALQDEGFDESNSFDLGRTVEEHSSISPKSPPVFDLPSTDHAHAALHPLESPSLIGTESNTSKSTSRSAEDPSPTPAKSPLPLTLPPLNNTGVVSTPPSPSPSSDKRTALLGRLSLALDLVSHTFPNEERAPACMKSPPRSPLPSTDIIFAMPSPTGAQVDRSPPMKRESIVEPPSSTPTEECPPASVSSPRVFTSPSTEYTRPGSQLGSTGKGSMLESLSSPSPAESFSLNVANSPTVSLSSANDSRGILMSPRSQLNRSPSTGKRTARMKGLTLEPISYSRSPTLSITAENEHSPTVSSQSSATVHVTAETTPTFVPPSTVDSTSIVQTPQEMQHPYRNSVVISKEQTSSPSHTRYDAPGIEIPARKGSQSSNSQFSPEAGPSNSSNRLSTSPTRDDFPALTERLLTSPQSAHSEQSEVPSRRIPFGFRHSKGGRSRAPSVMHVKKASSVPVAGQRPPSVSSISRSRPSLTRLSVDLDRHDLHPAFSAPASAPISAPSSARLKPLRLSVILTSSLSAGSPASSLLPSLTTATTAPSSLHTPASPTVSSDYSISNNYLLASPQSHAIPGSAPNTHNIGRTYSPLDDTHHSVPHSAPVSRPLSWLNKSQHFIDISHSPSSRRSSLLSVENRPHSRLSEPLVLLEEDEEAIFDDLDDTIRAPILSKSPQSEHRPSRPPSIILPRSPIHAIATPKPTLLFAIASDDVSEVKRVLESGEVGPNDDLGPHNALSLALTAGQLKHKMEMVKLLLAHGADPSLLRGDGRPGSRAGTPSELGSGRATPAMDTLLENVDPATRYYLARAEAPQTRRASALIHRSFFRPLTKVRYDLVGQDRALEQLFRVLSMLSNAPIVVLLCGPSGHGKSLLARKFGSLLDVPTHTVNMTTLRSTHDIWRSYSMSPYEDASTCTLAAFLMENEGKRCVVVLDEIEKVEDEKYLSSLLMPWELGRCSFEAGHRHVDVSKVIWLGTSNIGHDLVFKHQASRPDPESQMTREEYVDLMALLRPEVSGHLGPSLLSRVTTVLPFVPFTQEEKMAIAAEALYSLAGDDARSLPSATFEKLVQTSLLEYVPVEGARSLYRAVSTQLLDALY
ncbi:hypothetical protein ABKN59_008552 [Abortiporus biennis]